MAHGQSARGRATEAVNDNQGERHAHDPLKAGAKNVDTQKRKCLDTGMVEGRSRPQRLGMPGCACPEKEDRERCG
jgi:hypothetical protein